MKRTGPAAAPGVAMGGDDAAEAVGGDVKTAASEAPATRDAATIATGRRPATRSALTRRRSRHPERERRTRRKNVVFHSRPWPHPCAAPPPRLAPTGG